jgi:SAM-dependent methyltransferase
LDSDRQPKASPDDVIAAYEANAAAFDALRGRSLFELDWLRRFAMLATPCGRVLDLGCGAGAPIAEWLIANGFQLTGLDASPTLLAIAQARFPQAEWRLGDLRELPSTGQFDGIIAWHSLFHLTPSAQRAAWPGIIRRLNVGGVFLTTTGARACETTGAVGDARVYHASLDPAEYRAILAAHGMRVIAHVLEDAGCGGASVLLAVLDSGAD